MNDFYVEERTIQTMIDEFFSGFSAEDKEKIGLSVFELTESDFTEVGYIVYWCEKGTFLTTADDPALNEFNCMYEWAKKFESPEAAIKVAKTLADDKNTIKVLKYISSKHLSLFSPIWSNMPLVEM